jgi:hypothetical protein
MRAYFMQPPKPLRARHRIAGWWASKRLRGLRCWWDGGITRGMIATSVPWAQPRSKGESTGLWHPRLIPVPVPDTVLNQMPRMPLDGILTSGTFAALASPPFCVVLQTGRYAGVDLDFSRIDAFIHDLPGSQIADLRAMSHPAAFKAQLGMMQACVPSQGSECFIHGQRLLPDDEDEAREILLTGEYALRDPDGLWEPFETDSLLRNY